MPPVIISVVIPAYKESQLHITVARLLMQVCKWKYEIIVAEYNPDHDVPLFRFNSPIVHHVEVDKPGIAYARHQGIMAAVGKVIVNFDADAYFTHNNALELLAEPIMSGQAVLCVCDNAFNPAEIKTEADVAAMKTPQSILDFLNNTQRTVPFYGFLECGSAMDKEAYMFVGGFKDVKMWEMFDLSPRMFFHYPGMKKWINGVVAVTSARRALASARYGVKALDYSTAYRTEGAVSVT